jgi:hypothetical protein
MQSCSPHWKLSNGMWHATYTQGNWGNYQLLMVESQIANLTPSHSFGHNLCFKCPNESCKPILDIYVLRSLWWYKEFFNLMGSDPLQSFFKDSEVHRDSNSQSGSSLGSVRVHSFTLSYTPGLPFWPAPLQALALVASPRLRLQHWWTLESSKGNFKGQNSWDWRVPYIIRKLLELRCLKWARIIYLDT